MATAAPSLSNCLRRWRRKNHVSQAQLAADMGVSPSIISQWEQRRCTPTLRKFSNLSRRTGIPVRTLLQFFLREPADDCVVVEFPRRPSVPTTQR